MADIKLNKVDLPEEIQSLEVGDSAEIMATLTVTSLGKGVINATLEDIEPCGETDEAEPEEEMEDEEEATPSEGTKSSGKGMGVIIVMGGKHPKK